MNSVPGSAVATARAAVAPLRDAFSGRGIGSTRRWTRPRRPPRPRARRRRLRPHHRCPSRDHQDARRSVRRCGVDCGERFGTIACRIDGVVYEITTHRPMRTTSRHASRSSSSATMSTTILLGALHRQCHAVDLADGTRRPVRGGADLEAGRLRTPSIPRSRSPMIRCGCFERRASSPPSISP